MNPTINGGDQESAAARGVAQECRTFSSVFVGVHGRGSNMLLRRLLSHDSIRGSHCGASANIRPAASPPWIFPVFPPPPT